MKIKTFLTVIFGLAVSFTAQAYMADDLKLTYSFLDV